MADDGSSDVAEGLVQEQEADRLLAALTSLCKRVNTDITIQCDDETFHCHSELLKARSTVFFKMLEGGDRCKVLQIDDVKPMAMKDVIKYIYTGQVSITRDRMVDLITGGKKFELPGLLSKCLENFRNQIHFDNAADILVMAEKHGLEEFKKEAVKKIISNMTMLIADQAFRDKMMFNPGLLLQLFDNLCQAFEKAGSERVKDEGTKTVKQPTTAIKSDSTERKINTFRLKETFDKRRKRRMLQIMKKKDVADNDKNESPGRVELPKKKEQKGKEKKLVMKDASELFEENARPQKKKRKTEF